MRPTPLIAGITCLIASTALIATVGSMSMSSSPPPAPGKSTTAGPKSHFVEVDWDYWGEINPDIVAWIEVPKAGISLPVAQASKQNPDFYLKHDAFKRQNIYGCAYAVASSDIRDLAERTTLILAHHMNDGSMFSKLASLNMQSPVRAYLQTRTAREAILLTNKQIINASKTTIRTHYRTWEEYRTWQSESFGEKASEVGSRSICLATCSYGIYANQRTILYGKVIEIEEGARRPL